MINHTNAHGSSNPRVSVECGVRERNCDLYQTPEASYQQDYQNFQKYNENMENYQFNEDESIESKQISFEEEPIVNFQSKDFCLTEDRSHIPQFRREDIRLFKHLDEIYKDSAPRVFFYMNGPSPI